jgi:hypothetical protein
VARICPTTGREGREATSTPSTTGCGRKRIQRPCRLERGCRVGSNHHVLGDHASKSGITASMNVRSVSDVVVAPMSARLVAHT